MPARTGTVVMVVVAAFLPLSVVAGGIAADPAAAAVLPPDNPAADVALGSTNLLTATDDARAQEGVGPIPIDGAALDALPVAEQVFVLTNLERIGRGEAPISAMTTQLDAYAQSGANSEGDPSHPDTLTGGATAYEAGAVWVGGTSSALFANYVWMYEDGWGGSAPHTPNADCTSPGASGCWEHRDILLKRYSAVDCAGATPVPLMGAGASTHMGGSIAAVFVWTCGSAPSDENFTWGQAEAALGIDGTYPTSVAPGVKADIALTPTAVVDMTTDQTGNGYWLAAADGAVYGYGDASVYGSMLGVALNAPIVGIAATPDGRGYWLVASDGGIFSFGDASFHGSMGGQHLNAPVVAMTADPQTGGYWLVASDGGIFAFNAPFSGSTGNLSLVAPIVAIQAAPNGHGYRMDATDGGVFCFALPYLGSMGGRPIASPVLGMAADPQTGGYWLVAADGGVFSYNAPYLGSDA